jgi:4-hydroxybenzoate polyprenyltransferase
VLHEDDMHLPTPIPHPILHLKLGQGIKNDFISLPIIFARQLFKIVKLLASVHIVAVFGILGGTVNLFNDYLDREKDRHHLISRRMFASISPTALRICLFSVIDIQTQLPYILFAEN